MELVSVIIPTRDRPDAVLAAVASALAQSYARVEVLVCDDADAHMHAQGRGGDTQRPGDAEGRRGVLPERLPAGVRYIPVARCGLPGRVRNAGIAAARGTLLAFLDDDDVWDPAKLDRQVALLGTDPAIGLVWGNARLLHDDGSLSPPVLPEGAPAPLYDALLTDCFIHPSTVLVRRAALDAAGPFDDDLPICEDWDLWLRLARTTAGRYDPEPHTRVRRQAGSHSDRHVLLTYQTAVRVLERQLRLRLSPRQRFRCHRTIATMHVSAAAHARAAGDRAVARRHARAAVRHAPHAPGVWQMLGRTHSDLFS